MRNFPSTSGGGSTKRSSWPSAETAVPSAPARVTRYQPILELGRGGMATVHLAREIGIGGFERLVALKRMRPAQRLSPDLVSRFAHEARLAAHVRHANVVSVEHFGRDDEGLYLALEYVEGASLDWLIECVVARGERPPPPIVLRIVADACAGLHAVHEAVDSVGQPLSILHRDVSMHNILVGRDGVARITDLGIAKSALGAMQTERHRLVGKLLYMSPEYVRGEAVDRRLDVYAMGMTLWVALSGFEPWAELDDEELLERIQADALPPLSASGLRVAPELEAIVRHACAPDPKLRFASAGDMAHAIDQLGRETGWMATHAEVAAWVERLVGSRLAAQRRTIAAQIAGDARDASHAVAPAAGPLWTPSPAAATPWSIAKNATTRIDVTPRSVTQRLLGPGNTERMRVPSPLPPPPPGPVPTRRSLRISRRQRWGWIALFVIGLQAGALLAASDFVRTSSADTRTPTAAALTR